MSLSSKKIISYINSKSEPFTVQQMTAEMERPPAEKKGKRRKRQEPRTHTPVEDILRALCAVGLLAKQRKQYVRIPRFRLEGILKVNSSGDGILVNGEGDEFIIARDEMQMAHHNDLVEGEITDFRRGIFFARVRKVLRRKKEKYLARVERKTKSAVYFKLLDLPGGVEAYAEGAGVDLETGDLTVVRLGDRSFAGRLRVLEAEPFPIDTEDNDVRRIALRHSLPEPHGEYQELAGIGKNLPRQETENRKDYRKGMVITIDGEHAKDFDDGIALEKKGGLYHLQVHIADVSAYVEKGGRLDREALARGTSCYLANAVIPMLPEVLSNDLCSLREGEDRLTLSAEIAFDKNGHVAGSSFHRGIIRVGKRLTYARAHEILHEKKKSKMGLLLKDMFDLASILKNNRLSRGRVDLSLSDTELHFDVNMLTDITFARRLDSHLIVEECMLSANEAVSRALRENRVPALYRVHETISDEKMTLLKKFLSSLGLSLAKTGNTGTSIQRVIDMVAGKEYEQVVNFIILKSFMQAYYGAEPLGHFGLGFKDYTHFTSPIRRYPDLIVHRCLKSLIDKTPPPYTPADLAAIGEKSSEMERIAQGAERDLYRLKSCRFMSDRVGQSFDVVISGIGKFGFFVTLLDRPIEGMVPLRHLTDDFYLVKEDEFTIVGRKLGRRFRLGDKLRARLVSVDIEMMRMDFEVA